MNPLFARNQQTANNNGNMIAQFAEFKKQMAGKDPNQVLNDLIASGQVSRNQLDEAVTLAKSISKFLK